MAFVNLLQAIYPVGSVYFSTTSNSPANVIGGTWVQAKGAVLGITGANSFAGAASYGGALKISTNQMPSHYHTMTLISYSASGTEQTHTYPQGSNHGSLYDVVGAQDINHPVGGGGRTICPIISRCIAGIAQLNLFGGEIDGFC